MDKSKIDRSMYQKAKVEASEKEHIAAPASTMLADAWIRLKKNKAAVVALFILIGIILLAIFAPIFSKYSFRDTDYNNVYGLPSAAHIFGADQFGRDLWVRTWMGTRISLMIRTGSCNPGSGCRCSLRCCFRSFRGKGRRCYAAYY